MTHAELVEALEASIPEVELPIPGVQTPHGKLSFTSLRRLVKSAKDSVLSNVDKSTEWVLDQIPNPVKNRTTQKVNALNKKVNTYRIKGQREYDPNNFFNHPSAESIDYSISKRSQSKLIFSSI